MSLLSLRDLSVEFATRDGVVRAVSAVSFDLRPGQVLALLGESGSGKSVLLRSILGLHSTAHARVSGEVLVKGRDVFRLDERAREELRGSVVPMAPARCLASYPHETSGGMRQRGRRRRSTSPWPPCAVAPGSTAEKTTTANPLIFRD